MKKYIFKVLVVGGITFLCNGFGNNIDDALMDACDQLAKAGEYPELDIEDVRLYNPNV